MFSLVMAVCVIVGAGEVIGIVVGEGLLLPFPELACTSHEPPLAVLKYTVDESYNKHPLDRPS